MLLQILKFEQYVSEMLSCFVSAVSKINSKAILLVTMQALRGREPLMVMCHALCMSNWLHATVAYY